MPATDMKGIIGTDQTGRFPTTSARDHKYIFVLTDLDSDYIHVLKVSEKYVTNLVLTTLWAATVSHSPMAP